VVLPSLAGVVTAASLSIRGIALIFVVPRKKFE